MKLQNTGANQTREQAGGRSGHDGREDGALAKDQPEGYGRDGSKPSTRPETPPGNCPVCSLVSKRERNCDRKHQYDHDAGGQEFRRNAVLAARHHLVR